jgi:hypothetical protein
VQQDSDISEPGEDGTEEQKTDDEETKRAARIKQIVDALPPLTDEQKDILALIFSPRRRH